MHTVCVHLNCGLQMGRGEQSWNQFRKPGVRIPEAIPAFVTIPDDESDPHEQRFVILGIGAMGRLLVVVYTWQGEDIRIISARAAEAHEREQYEAERS